MTQLTHCDQCDKTATHPGNYGWLNVGATKDFCSIECLATWAEHRIESNRRRDEILDKFAAVDTLKFKTRT